MKMSNYKVQRGKNVSKRATVKSSSERAKMKDSLKKYSPFLFTLQEFRFRFDKNKYILHVCLLSSLEIAIKEATVSIAFPSQFQPLVLSRFLFKFLSLLLHKKRANV
jgi:hypothetical protein